jgi:hypothetical protein
VRYSRALKVGLSLTAGLAVAGTAAGVTYAATTASTKAVYACANKPGTLRLLAKGKCPSGYAKVAINKQGPRGLTGARGPQGPGAVPLTAAATGAAASSPASRRTLTELHLVFGVDCKTGDHAALDIGFDSAAPSGWTVSGLTYTSASAYGLKVNGTSYIGGSGSWGFDKAVDGFTGNYVRVSLGYDTNTSSGYRLQGSLLVTRGGHSATVQFALDDYLGDTCSARAQVTPSA